MVFLRNMFFAWLQVPSMMMTLCFTVPTSWYFTSSSRFWDLGPGYRMSVLLSRHTAASSGCLVGEEMEGKKPKYICGLNNSGVGRVLIHLQENTSYFSSLNLLPTMTLHFPCGKQAASRGTVRSTRLS